MKIIYWQMTYLFKMESVMNYLYYTGCFARTFTHLHGSLVTCNTRSRSSSTVKSPIPAGLILRSRCGDLADDSMHVIHIYMCVFMYMHLCICLFVCFSVYYDLSIYNSPCEDTIWNVQRYSHVRVVFGVKFRYSLYFMTVYILCICILYMYIYVCACEMLNS